MQWYAFVDQPLTLGCAHLNYFYIETNNVHIVFFDTHVFSISSRTASCSSPCQNGGTCTGVDTCTCVAGWTGTLCETGMLSLTEHLSALYDCRWRGIEAVPHGWEVKEINTVMHSKSLVFTTLTIMAYNAQHDTAENTVLYAKWLSA